MFHGGQLPVDQLLSGTIKLEEINEGFDRLHKGEVARQVILL
jgi:alcohol dehydrogenase